MSKLKVHKIGDLCFDFKMGKDVGIDFYLKSEADKVIAEKDNELRHQKYKRCLAMAKWCDAKADWYYSICESFRDRVEFYIKWRNRWLKLAEKFKEAK